MFVVRVIDPDNFRVEGPFHSVMEAREYLADVRGGSRLGEVIYVEPPDEAGLCEPGT